MKILTTDANPAYVIPNGVRDPYCIGQSEPVQAAMSGCLRLPSQFVHSANPACVIPNGVRDPCCIGQSEPVQAAMSGCLRLPSCRGFIKNFVSLLLSSSPLCQESTHCCRHLTPCIRNRLIRKTIQLHRGIQEAQLGSRLSMQVFINGSSISCHLDKVLLCILFDF